MCPCRQNHKQIHYFLFSSFKSLTTYHIKILNLYWVTIFYVCIKSHKTTGQKVKLSRFLRIICTPKCANLPRSQHRMIWCDSEWENKIWSSNFLLQWRTISTITPSPSPFPAFHGHLWAPPFLSGGSCHVERSLAAVVCRGKVGVVRLQRLQLAVVTQEHNWR